MSNEIKIRLVVLYYQTERQAGAGNAGWAYNVISLDGEHTSDGFETSASRDDGGSESLSEVREAFTRAWPEAAAQVTHWDANPEGGWEGRP